jgi:hypothetical protein
MQHFYLYAQRQVISVCGTHIQTNPQYQCPGKSHADLSVIIFSNKFSAKVRILSMLSPVCLIVRTELIVLKCERYK